MSRAVAALALVAAFVAIPLADVRPVAGVAQPTVVRGGEVEPSAPADPTDRYIVVYRDGADRSKANSRAKGRGIGLDRTFRAALKGYAAKLTKQQLAEVKTDPDVAYVMQDGIIRAQAQTIPRGVRRVDGLRNTIARIDGVDQRVDADVAIFDTGISKSHPDLNVVGGHNCSSANPDAWGDGNGHGTHVAGTVGALDNGTGVVGVAPGVRLWAVRILGSDGVGLISWYVCGMDWIAAQRDPVDPTRPLIEAVNMSVAKSGSDDRNCGFTNKDAMHKAICRLVESGVTVVAAAGNNSFNASRLIPASYDEVITVSALADTDGLPGGTGGNACYSWGTYDKDDTYADFSNYGADVDIIAPGKCIWSTVPGGYGYSSGTSMAAPHVTGAAALWLSTRPGATPAQARAGILAATTMDWRSSTDPDSRPDPLLDVSRIVAPDDYSVEAGRIAGWVNAAGATKTVALKVIRGEAFDEDVTLTAAAPAPLTARVEDPQNAKGDATTSLSVTVPAKTASGTYNVKVTAADGTRQRTLNVSVAVDSAGPKAVAPTVAPRSGTTFGTTSYSVRARWAAASDNASGIASYQASWRVDGGSWSAPASFAASKRTYDRTFSTSRSYELRVRARDGAGNWGAWVAAPAFTTGVVQDTSTSLVKRGTWGKSVSTSWSRGSALYSRSKGATVSRTFTGRAIAWVGAKGKSRGSARISINGTHVATVSLYAGSNAFRRIVYARSWSTAATRTITITVVGTSGHPRVDLDALVIVR